jgi:hypothetical protein
MFAPTTAKVLAPVNISDHVGNAIRAYMARTNATLKMVARDVDAAESTVKGWTNGYFDPSGDNLIILARAIPEVRTLVLQLIGHEPSEQERQFQAKAAEMLAILRTR